MLTILLWLGCTKNPGEAKGSIYGYVTDFANGKSVANANVILRQTGESTLTGSDGMYEFLDVSDGNYSIKVTKADYSDLIDDFNIVVSDGKKIRRDVQITRLTSELRILGSDGNDITELDFGAETDVTSRIFSIFNDSPREITWWIDEDCKWISEVKSMRTNQTGGDIEPNRQEPIKVTIDRSKLDQGVINTYILSINSDNGSLELTIKAGEELGLPTLTTEPVTNLTQSSAKFNGKIVSEGSPAYTERGFVYSSSPRPSIDSNNIGRLTSAVNNQFTFSANVSGLISNSSYYVRAYAINQVGVAYGNDVVFSTDLDRTQVLTSAATNISSTSATLNGVITAQGSPAYTEKGFCYSTASNPSITNSTKVTVDGSGEGSYSTNINNLNFQTTYHVRAYAIQNGVERYGEDKTFTTSWRSTAVQTSAVSSISATSATFNGNISDEGEPPYTERGFCYSTTTNPTISNTHVTVTGSGSGNFSKNVTNLNYQTTYYARAYALQNGTPVYGNSVAFTTAWTNTEVTTSAVNNISATSATFNGIINVVGDPAYTERGFCYSTTTNPTISNTHVTVTGSGSGNYSKNVTNLNYQTTYYVRAYAIQNGSPIYGSTVSFTTTWTDAAVSTSAVNNITTTSAKFNGVVTNAGNPTITERGFCYSTTNNNPTISNTQVTVTGTSSGSYYKNMTNLVSGQTYYVRAYVIQAGNAIYGSPVSFSTNQDPTVYTDAVSNLTPVSSGGIITSWNVTFNGHIGSVGTPAYVERGFCYGTSMNPTGNRQIVSGSGTGNFTKSITGLQNYQTYYVRAYAKTASGAYVYGQNVSFQTYDW